MPGTGGYFARDVVVGWLESFRSEALWGGLCSGDPGLVSDPLTIEVLGDAYRRVGPVQLDLSGTLLRNASPWKWVGLVPGTRVAGIAIWNAAFNGKVRSYLPLELPIDFPTGGNLAYDAGDLFWGVDS